MKHLEVAVGDDHIQLEQIPTRWWLVDETLRRLCTLTGCRACTIGPIYRLWNYSMNRPSRTRIDVLVTAERRQQVADWAGINLRAGWDDDEPDDDTDLIDLIE
jgi:hypothetical protein